MDDFENPTVEEAAGDGQERVVDAQDEGAEQESRDAGESAEPAEGFDGGDADRRKAEQDKKPADSSPFGGKNSREFNSAMAAARRRAEQETAERMLRERDEQIAALHIPNPNKPGESFGSFEALKEYAGIIRRSEAEKRAKETGRNVEEIMAEDEERAFVREQMAKDSARKAAADAQRRQRDFIASDLAAFQEKHPDVDVARLDGNQQFRRFAGSRYGKEPLADLYEDFVAIVGEAGASAIAKQESHASRGTGSGSGSGGNNVLTAAQRAELREWNENFPQLKMSEKEFLDMQ